MCRRNFFYKLLNYFLIVLLLVSHVDQVVLAMYGNDISEHDYQIVENDDVDYGNDVENDFIYENNGENEIDSDSDSDSSVENNVIDEGINEVEEIDVPDAPAQLNPEAIPNPANFTYPTTVSGWAYNALAFQNISFLNETIFAATNVSVSIVPTGDTTVVAFEYFGGGLGVGAGGGVFNGTTSIMPNGGQSHIRLRPAHEVIAGTHTNLLILQGDNEFRVEVPLTVTITQHPGGVANPTAFVWPDLEYGYQLVSTFGALTGPRHINFTSTPPMLNVTNDRINFAMGADSPFEVNRGVYTGATGGSATTTIGANTNIRIRPRFGLPVGLHEDILIIEGDGASRIEVPVSLNVVDWSGDFNYSLSRRAMDFGVRDVGYTTFAWATTESILVMTNHSEMGGIFGLDGSYFSFESEDNGGTSNFEFEPVGFRQGSSTSTASNPPRNYIPPNNTVGQLRIRPRTGLPAGVYTDTLHIRGDRGFATTVELMFVVNMPDANVTVSPSAWAFAAEYEGYSFNPVSGLVRGWQEFIFINHTPTNQPAEITFESGLNAANFESGVTSPFRVQRSFTDQTLTNPSGSTTVRQHINANIPTGIRIFPHNGLPVGTHTDILIISNNYGLDIRIPLTFTVLPLPEDIDPLVVVTPGRVYRFPSRQVGAQTQNPNNNTRWQSFSIFNHTGSTITGVSARFESGDDSPFSFNRALGNGTGTGLTSGAVNIGVSGTLGTTVGANVRVWPNEGLPVGLHRDVLILENATGFRKEIILYFEVTEINVSINRSEFTWPTRHVRYNRHHQNAGVLNNVNNETDHSITGSAEFILTNHGDSPVRLPAWTDNSYTRTYFDSVINAGGNTAAAWVVMHRAISAQSAENPNMTTNSTAVTIVQPGMSVSLRFVPLANRPPGVYHDVFNIRDFYGHELGQIEFNFEVIEWDLGAPAEIVFDSRQVGYTINMATNTSATVPGTDAYVFTLANLREFGNLENTPSVGSSFFELGDDSPFTTNIGTSTGTGMNGRGVIVLDASRSFWVRPREGLAPGLHEDYFVLTNTGRNPYYDPLVRIPLSIYIYEPDLIVRENGEIIDPADGVEFTDRMPGYTLDEHNVNDYIRLSFENLGVNPFNNLTATILQPDLSAPSNAFSVMTGINGGAAGTNTVNVLPVDGMVNLRVWQRLDLPIGTHEAVLRLGNNLGFEVFVPLRFTVNDFDTEFFDVVFETRLEDFVDETQTAEFTLRNNSTTPAFIINAVLERGTQSPFELIGTTHGTVIGDDLLAFDVRTRSDLDAGLHYDYIIITGNFGFERRVRVEFEVLAVYHDLTFHLQGGTNLDVDDEETFAIVQPVRLNQAATRPVINPTRIGYYFVNWYTEATGGSLFDFTTLFTRAVGDVEIYARWNVSYHEISFNVHGGIGDFPDQTIRDGQVVTEPVNDPTRVGYEFVGWYTEATGGELFNFDQPVIRLNPSEVVLHARWNELYHDVTFELHGGSGNFPMQVVRDGQMMLMPTLDPTPPTGYLFRGWYTAETDGNLIDFSQPVTSDKVVHAKWVSDGNVVVTFDPTGGVILGYTGVATRVVTIEDSVTAQNMPPNPTQAGYYFVGWYTSATGGVSFTEETVVTGNMTIYARWNELYHDVTFNLHGGSGNFPLQAVRDGQLVLMPALDPTPPRNHDFVGWYTSATGGEVFDFSQPITEETVIHARWESDGNVAVTFDPTEGVILGYPTVAIRDVAIASSIGENMPQSPTRVGYYFAGWYTAATGGELFTATSVVSSDMTVYARWNELYHEVTFNLRSGSGNFPMQVIRDGQLMLMPTLDPTAPIGHEFIGWYNAATGGSRFDFSQPITRDTVVYARWNPEVYVVLTFDPTGGAIDGNPNVAIVDIPIGAPARDFMPQDPIRIGYYFAGWYTLATGGELFTETVTVNSDMTVYARWNELHHNVTFDLHDGSGSFPLQVIRNGQMMLMPVIDPTPPLGHDFAGWYTLATGGELFDFSQPITNDTVVHARWRALPIEIVFDLHGGVGDFPIQALFAGETVDKPEVRPLRTGYEFVGWFEAAEEGEMFDFSRPLVQSKVIHARWVEISEEVNPVIPERPPAIKSDPEIQAVLDPSRATGESQIGSYLPATGTATIGTAIVGGLTFAIGLLASLRKKKK